MTPDELKNKITAFQESRIILTAYELNIFEVIAKNELSSIQIAEKLQTHPRATDRLLNSLCTIGLLEKNNHLFKNTAISLQYFTANSSEYISGLMHTVNLWNNWSKLTEAVKIGKSPLNAEIAEQNTEWLKAFIAAMHDRGKIQAPKVAKLLDLSNVNTILDIGGGSAAFTIGLAQAKKTAQCYVFDLPEVTPITQKYIKESNLENQIFTINGNYNQDDIPGKYDLIFISAVIHINNFEQNQQLIKKCSNALNSGGQIVIQDFIIDENRTTPKRAVYFALNMLVGTESGDTYTESEVNKWYAEAGLSDFKRIDTEWKATLLIARNTKNT